MILNFAIEPLIYSVLRVNESFTCGGGMAGFAQVTVLFHFQCFFKVYMSGL